MTHHAQRNDIDDYFSSERISGRNEAVELTADSYREFLIDLDDPMLADVRGMDYKEFSADKHQAPFLQDLVNYWTGLYNEPFVGVTSAGVVIEDLYELPATAVSDPVPAEAAQALLGLLSAEQRDQVSYAVDAPEWRSWSNPEFVIFRTGLRLEELSDEVVQAILGVFEASLSPEGYEQVTEAMNLNEFLGDLVGLPKILNSRSYWFSLFGQPSADQPWGWQLFGHHVALNFISVGGRHVIAPAFIGAEPALTDEERAPLFEHREEMALDLVGSLDEEQRTKAIVYDSVLDPAMPEGRLHPADERHVAGAFRDNRVIPYEGIRATQLTDSQWEQICKIAEDFHLLLTAPQRQATMVDFRRHREATYFSWYGATDGTQPFYFRFHSPVLFAELDHHAGVWLNNRLPARFHVHAVHRMPNGNDYGKAYLAQWQERQMRMT